MRITQDLHDRLNEAKIHPDETINTVLQRLLFSYHVNKLVYRINLKSINNKDSKDLMFFMRELLLTEPKFNNALFVEVVSVENYPEIKLRAATPSFTGCPTITGGNSISPFKIIMIL